MKRNNKKKLSNILTMLQDNRKVIYSFVIGLVLGLFILVVTRPERIATLEDGTQPVATMDNYVFTADELYADMKDYYSVSILLDAIDSQLLTEKYPESEEMTASIESTLSQYESYYGENFESQLQQNGIASIDEFKEMLKLDFRRNEAVSDYVESKVTDGEIDKYYNDNVYGDIDSKHILVSPDITDGMADEEKTEKEEEALNIAKEIITKLDSGASWDEVVEEYKDSITSEELGFHSYDASLEVAYLNAEKDLAVGSYTKTPVETSYGYHIIYKNDQKEKPELDTVKEKIVSSIASDKLSEDTNLRYVTLFAIREEAHLEFNDTVMKEKYEMYKQQYQ
ncbi:MAG: peptidylprolyl isomerase [bacterium]|nr:peptidylprolyl isomerase [bacterium]